MVLVGMGGLFRKDLWCGKMGGAISWGLGYVLFHNSDIILLKLVKYICAI